MLPEIEQLKHDKQFRLLDELEFGNMIPFVMDQIRKKSIITTLFWLSHFLLLGWIIYTAATGKLKWNSILGMSIAGVFAGSVLVIPFHEGLHALTYYLIGARKIKLGADFRQMIFYITADSFVIDGNRLALVALTPFAGISLFILLLSGIVAVNWELFLLVLLLCHNIMCIGDFALVNYVFLNRSRKIYTYDLIREKKSYIYGFANDSDE